MKKLKYLSIVMVMGLVVLLTSATAPITGENGIVGKRGEGFHRGMHRGMHQSMMLNNLSDEQKTQIKELRIEMMKNSLPVRNELNEKRARLRTLTTGDKVDVKGAEKVLADIEKLKTQQAKQRVRMRVEVRKILNDEQRAMFDAHAVMGEKGRQQGSFHKRQPVAKQMRGNAGQMQGRPCMQGMHGKMPKQGMKPGMKQGMKSRAGMGMKGKQGAMVKDGKPGKHGMMGKQGSRPGMQQGGVMNFTAEQQEQLKPLKIEQMKTMTQFRNELGEFKAKMKTLISADDVNLKDVDKLLDEMGEVKLSMAKSRLAHKQSVRAILTDEQKVMMDIHN